jgi:hypothetical protein
MAAEALEQDDAQRLRICADALRAARSMRALSTGLSIVAAGGGAVAAVSAAMLAIAFWSAALAIGVIAQWVGFRVAFDARLFARLADDAKTGTLDLARFDAAMSALGLMPIDKVGRSVDARCKGALALLRALGIVIVVQAVLVVVAGVALRGSWT